MGPHEPDLDPSRFVVSLHRKNAADSFIARTDESLEWSSGGPGSQRTASGPGSAGLFREAKEVYGRLSRT